MEQYVLINGQRTLVKEYSDGVFNIAGFLVAQNMQELTPAH